VGIIGILQTWARDMRYHVHAHFIVPAGGLSPDGKRWLPVQRRYFMPQRALADIFRGKFRDALEKVTSNEEEETKLFDQVPEKVWSTQWVADVKSVGTGRSAIKYLAPYIFRIAISNKRITRFKDGEVTFNWQDNKDIWHSKTLEAEKFMSCFLQHVLPQGFVKVHYYGFLSTRKRQMLEDIKKLFENVPDESGTKPSDTLVTPELRVISCPKCGKPMVFIAEIRSERNRSP
jgi:hypothetical protein